jgi:endonuclease/exonuclease/phosphatase (EEP) superfamily protein YafD
MGLILKLLGGLVRLAAFLLASGCAAAAVAGQFARTHPRLDVINQFAPAWIIGAFLAAVLGRRDWPTLVIAAMAAGASALQIMPELTADRYEAKPAAGAARLKLIEFNAWVHNRAPARAAAWILGQDPDVVVMEEAAGNAVAIVQALRSRYRFVTSCGANCSTLILSKQRPLAGGPFERSGMVATWARFRDAAGAYTVVAMHSPHPSPPGPQTIEHVLLARVMRKMDSRRLILAGDFNNTPWTFETRRLDRSLPLIRRDRALATWPAAEAGLHGRKVTLPFPILPIDHIYAGPGWRTLSMRRGPTIGSDHRPLVVELQAAPSR